MVPQAHLSEWRESYVLETQGLPTNYQTSINWENSLLRFDDPTVRPGTMKAQEIRNIRILQYIKAVLPYTRRELSYQSHIVLAFGGIISKFFPAENQTAILKHGLPIKSLPIALFWEAVNPGRLTRRTIDGAINSCAFPSWSWAGWKGAVTYPLRFGDLYEKGWL